MNQALGEKGKLPKIPLLFRTDCGYILVAGLGTPPPKTDLSQRMVAVPSSMFASLRHLIMAAFRACRSIAKGVNIADAFAYELVICLTGIREISKLKEELAKPSKGYALIVLCDHPFACRSLLLNLLVRGAKLVEVEPAYIPRKLPSCSDSGEALAMEEGAMVELDR
ncbi:MAG: hypothetical protein J7L91_01270 [Candidatus Korarchaeota archaeon]|nr:hypothetical protein [Candidatus Korarchaeota archaeon]